MRKKEKGKNIQSIQRAIDIMNCFNEGETELSLGEITNKLQLNKSTVHGIINTLHNNSYLQQNSNGNYMLGQALFNKSLYAIHATKIRLRTLSKSHMIRVSNKYKCTSHVFALEGQRLQCLDMTLPINSHYVISPVLNNVMHLHCTASGKIVLTHMSMGERNVYFEQAELKTYTKKTLISKEDIIKNTNEIIQNGYAFEDEEVEEGCLSVAVPVFTNNEMLFGTLSVTASKIKIHTRIQEIAEDLAKISQELSIEIFGP